VNVPSPAPHTSSGLLLQIDLDTSKPLTFEALCHPILISVGFTSDDDMTELDRVNISDAFKEYVRFAGKRAIV